MKNAHPVITEVSALNSLILRQATQQAKPCNEAQISNAKMVSGMGQFHTNDYDPDKPTKKLTPYLFVEWSDITTMAENPSEVDKSKAQWFNPSTYPSRTFNEQEAHGQYWVLCFDFDENTTLNLSEVDDLLYGVFRDSFSIDMQDFETLLYYSSGATPEKLKCRVLIPLAIVLTYREYKAVLTLLNDAIEAEGLTPDRALQRAAQLVYLPNRGEHYECLRQGKLGVPFNPLTTMAKELDDYFKAEAAKIEAARIEREERKAQALIKRDSIVWGQYSRPIDAFNSAYTVDEILAQHGYDFDGKHRYRHPDSESGSYSASVRDGRVYALSPNDPLYNADASKRAHDAFSVLCTLTHGGDEKAAIIDAGNNWLTIDGQPWNKVAQREFMQTKAATNAVSMPFLDMSSGVQVAQKLSKSAGSNVISVSNFLGELKAPCYVWQGIAEKECLYAIVATPGSGKTAISLAMALAMTQGSPFHKRETMQSKVLYLCGENPSDVKRRFKVLLDSRGLSLAQVEDRIFFTRKPFHIDNESARNQFLLDAAEHAPYDVIFIDTVPAHSGVDSENDNSQQQQLAQALREIGEDIGQPCIFALMHPPHNAKRETLLPRGGSSFTGSIDGVICIWRASRQSPSEMFAHQSKFRGHWPESVYFDLQVATVTDMVCNHGCPVNSVIAIETGEPAKDSDNAGNEAAHAIALPKVKVEILSFIKFIVDQGYWVGNDWYSPSGNHLCKKGFIDYEQFPPSLYGGKEKPLAMRAVNGLLNDKLLVLEDREVPSSKATKKRDRLRKGLWLTQEGLEHLAKETQARSSVLPVSRDEYAQASSGH